MVEIMHKAIIKDDYDICICGTNHVDENNNIIGRGVYRNSISYGKDVMVSFFEAVDYDPVSACDKLYKTSVIKENGLLFDEQNQWGEDLPFNYLFFKHVGKLVSVENCLYNYLKKRDGSITDGVTYGKVNRWKSNYRPIIKKERNDPANYKLVLKRHVTEIMCCCRELLGSTNEELIDACYPDMVKEINTYYNEFKGLKDLSIPVRLSVFLIHFNSNLFKLLYIFYYRKKHKNN